MAVPDRGGDSRGGLTSVHAHALGLDQQVGLVGADVRRELGEAEWIVQDVL